MIIEYVEKEIDAMNAFRFKVANSNTPTTMEEIEKIEEDGIELIRKIQHTNNLRHKLESIR